MATYREAVSKVINVFKMNNKDDKPSSRFILQLIKDTLSVLIAQKWLDRSILSETNLYTIIPCFEFTKVETKDCPSIDFRLCNTLMKSTKPLPKLVFSRLGASIKNVVSLDGNFTFTFLDEAQHRRNSKRQHSLKNEVYVYLGSDNHLYIPDQEIYSIDLTVLTLNPEDACSECLKKDCKSNWDYELVISDKLLDAVYGQVYQTLGITRQIRADENPNNIAGA